MEVGVHGTRVLVKLERGEEFLPSLLKALEDKGVTSGVVTEGIGALEEFELGWFDPDTREYVRNRFETSHELLSMQGTVTLGSDPPIHVHCSLANEHHAVVGGHLFGGTVSVLAEVAIDSLGEVRLERKVNPKTGLKELSLETE